MFVFQKKTSTYWGKKMYRYHKGLILIRYKKKPHSEMRKKNGCTGLILSHTSYSYVNKKNLIRKWGKKMLEFHIVSYVILHTSYFILTSIHLVSFYPFYQIEYPEGRPSGPTALGALRGWEGPGLAGQACLHNCVTGLEQFGQGTRGRVSRLILILDKGTSSRSNWCAFL